MISSRRTGIFASVTIAAAALTILIIAGAQGHQLTLPADVPRADESGRVPINDIDMWYAIFNKRGDDPVLLIHGGLGSADTWGNSFRRSLRLIR